MAGIIVGIIIISFIYNIFTGKTEITENNNNKEYSFFCTTQISYDFAKNIFSKDDTIYLIDREEDFLGGKIYEPTSKDLRALRKADIIFYCGDEAEPWVKDVVNRKIKKEKIFINILDSVEIKNNDNIEEFVFDINETPSLYAKQQNKKDYIAWTTPTNAKEIVWKMYSEVYSLNSKRNKEYKENYDLYKGEIEKIESKYQDEEKIKKDVVFGSLDNIPVYVVEKYFSSYGNCMVDNELNKERLEEVAKKTELNQIILTDKKYYDDVKNKIQPEKIYIFSDMLTHKKDFNYIDEATENLLAIKKVPQFE